MVEEVIAGMMMMMIDDGDDDETVVDDRDKSIDDHVDFILIFLYY